MMRINGQFNSAEVMTDTLDETAIVQIRSFLNHRAFAGGRIVIMPDCHAGAGAVIGFTMKMNDYIIPNVIGVDIGCGIEAYNLGSLQIDFAALDRHIRTAVPSGFAVKRHADITDAEGFFTRDVEHSIERIAKKTGQDLRRVLCSLGTLGGGNHFIEIDRDEAGNAWLVIHTGSRNFGLKIATYHQNIAKKIDTKRPSRSPSGLEYLERGSHEGEEYLSDMQTAQSYAVINRRTIAESIISGFFSMDINRIETVKSVHNYISFSDNIIRKGAIAAPKNERVIIPFNMRDGLILGRGKGVPEWNSSAPHGAGRRMSRHEAKEKISLDDFKKTMKGVWSSSLGKGTLDEAPMAYKPMNEILSVIGDTVEIENHMKPVFNFKGGSE